MVGSSYSEDQCIHTFLDIFEEGWKYWTQRASHQAELRREGNFPDQKSWNISSLQNDYLNLDGSLGFDRGSEGANDVQTECTFCGGVNHFAEQCFKKVRNENEKGRSVDVSS